MHEESTRFHKYKFIDDKLINFYLVQLEQQIKVEALIVFGSRARGDAFKTSDYDIAVISDSFIKMPKLKRTFFLMEKWDADFALEPIAYTIDEFKNAKGLLIWDILEEGIAFKDTGIFKRKKIIHEKLKKTGKLKKVEGGWKLSVA